MLLSPFSAFCQILESAGPLQYLILYYHIYMIYHGFINLHQSSKYVVTKMVFRKGLLIVLSIIHLVTYICYILYGLSTKNNLNQ